MNIAIDRAALLRALSHVQSVVKKLNTIPILAHVLLRAGDGELSLIATDMELEIVETVPAEVIRAGAATAPAHMIYEIVRKLPEGAQIEIETGDGGTMTLRAGRSQFRLGTMPVDDFPQITTADLQCRFELTAGELKGLIDRTRFAISTEETRYYLNGIYFHATRSLTGSGPGAAELPVLRAVATDGHRLARMEIPLPDGAVAMPGIIVPRKAVAEIRKLADEAGDRIELSMSETKIRFAFDTIILTSKLIDGRFPDYERVIPAGNDKVLEINAKVLARAVDRVATVSTDKSRSVKLGLDRGLLTLSATSAEAGSAVEEIEVGYDDRKLEIGFNSRYLLDVTQLIEGETIRLAMADAAAPILVRDVDDGSALFVLMPMRV